MPGPLYGVPGPVASAAQTLSRLRMARSDLTVILTSGHPEQNALECFQEKLDEDPLLAGFLKKPYGPSEMLDVVRAAISKASSAPAGR